MKKCYKCNEVKNLEEFYNNRRTKDGRQSMCIACTAVFRKRYNKNPDYKKEVLPAGKKRCPSCKEVKDSIEDFGESKHRHDGFYAYCKICMLNKSKSWREENPDKYKESNRRHNIKRKGLTQNEYDKLENIREGLCHNLMCSNEAYAIDHNHDCCSSGNSCGKCVRGLLCNGCNSALGMLEENISRIEGLIMYLKESK